MPKGSEGCPNLRNSQKAAAKAHKGPACHICLASLEDALEEDMRVQEIILLRNNPMKERRCPLLAISDWLLWWCFCILYLCNPLWGNCGEAAIKADIWACDLIRLFGFSDYTGQFVLWNNSVYREELWRCFSVWVRVERRVKRCSGRTRAEALTSCGHWGTENAFGTHGSFAPRDFVLLCELNLQKNFREGKSTSFIIRQISSLAAVLAPVYGNGTFWFSTFAQTSAGLRFFINIVGLGEPLIFCQNALYICKNSERFS